MGSDHDKKTEKIMELAKLLQLYSANVIDRTEGNKELVSQEFITEEDFNRMVDNELLGLIKEIEMSLMYYKGLN